MLKTEFRGPPKAAQRVRGVFTVAHVKDETDDPALWSRDGKQEGAPT
jgi:hypothetical protein